MMYIHFSHGLSVRSLLLGMYRRHPVPVYHLTYIRGPMKPISCRYRLCPPPSPPCRPALHRTSSNSCYSYSGPPSIRSFRSFFSSTLRVFTLLDDQSKTRNPDNIILITMGNRCFLRSIYLLSLLSDLHSFDIHACSHISIIIVYLLHDLFLQINASTSIRLVYRPRVKKGRILENMIQQLDPCVSTISRLPIQVQEDEVRYDRRGICRFLQLCYRLSALWGTCLASLGNQWTSQQVII